MENLILRQAIHNVLACDLRDIHRTDTDKSFSLFLIVYMWNNCVFARCFVS